MELSELVDPAELEREIEAAYVSRKSHPSLPLSIFTYTRSCQYERHWTPVTIACRGLIADDSTGAIVARPFSKFFNVGEHEHGYDYAPPLPDEPFEIYDKVDGSLGIVFHHDGAWHVASKGSFTSEQAQWGQRWLDDHERHTEHLAPGHTYLAEIVYPENRIVVNHGDQRTLVLLAVHAPDGAESPLWKHREDWWALGGQVVQSWPALPLPELVKMAALNEKLDGSAATGSDAEGWVIRFASGARAKVKLAEYVRLHKVLTGVNARDVWRALAVTVIGDRVDVKRTAQALTCSAAEIEAMRQVADPIGAILDNVPDEFDQWVRGICADLTAHADALLAEIEVEFEHLLPLARDRGAFARAAQRLDPAVRAAMFLMLDGKELALHIWRTIKPEVSTPFRDDEEG
jgi:RNA ligase